MGDLKKIDNNKALTFDDVLIVPQNSDVEPSETDISSYLSRSIKLKLPFIGSPMSDVSGTNFCIAMAQQGAFSFLHRNYTTPKEQADAILEVKTHEGYIRNSPVTVTPDMSIGDIRAMKKSNNFEFSSFPVVNSKLGLLGIITETDYYLEPSSTMVRDRMTTDVATINVKDAQDRTTVREILRKEKKKRLLVINDDNTLTGLITGKDFTIREFYPSATRDAQGRLMVGGTIGVSEKDLLRAKLQYDAGADAILIDISHGDCKSEIEMVKKLRKEYGDNIVIGGGNIATASGVENLASAGVDFVRIGIGAGSICTTRVVLGAGVPQITAILECSDSATAHGIYSIADGGIKQYGDIAKALAAGADTVMMGSLFAGAEETPGRKVLIDGRLFKIFKGMASKASILDRGGAGASRYNEAQSDEDKKIITQGVEGIVPYKGKLEDVLYQMQGSLQRSLGIVGARNMDEFYQKAILREISQSGDKESHPSVRMTEQPDNYMGK